MESCPRMLSGYKKGNVEKFLKLVNLMHYAIRVKIAKAPPPPGDPLFFY